MTATITCAGCQHAYADSALFCPNCGRPKAREVVADPLVGKVLGERFLVHEHIGQGASGTIYRAEHVTLRRKVAIKVLHQELSRDDLAVERFRREATTVAEIDNEHIVEIHDFGRTPDGRLYLAMELLEGETLDSVLAREKQLSVERVADIISQVGEALMEAHAIGYVHRDLRPRNLYLAVRRGKANFVKLLDFGLAKLVETEGQAASTSLGMTFGDPRYMSPEQARGDRIDRRADIYQLGCIAYEMLTGAPPFTGARVFDILTKQVTEAPVPLPTKRAGIPLWMEAAVAKMLAKDPENRFATTTRMVEALRRGLETGEVMDDEIARRRESIPPPSVSRVMQKMGIPVATASSTAVGSAPAAAPAPAAPADPAVPAPPVVPPEVEPGATMRAPVPPAPVKAAVPDSVELLRKRTGTPRLGAPIVDVPGAAKFPAAAAAKEPEPEPRNQQPVAGTIDPPVAAAVSTSPPAMPAPIAPIAPAKRAPTDPGTSQSWFDEGDDDTAARAKRRSSASRTDLSLYDDDLPARSERRWGIYAAAGAVLLAGGIVFAMIRGGSSSSDGATPAPQPVAVPSVVIDAAPSTILGGDTPQAPAPDAPQVAVKVADPKHPVPNTGETHAVPTPAHPTGPTGFSIGAGDDPSLRRPGGTPPVATPPVVTPPVVTPPVVTPPAKDPGTGSGGVTDGPKDPYGAGDEPPTDVASAEKKAEFYANLGVQQLSSNDTAGAAASFKRALELDGKSVAAMSGMGEIALRQGLFGDAIAHLSKAARLSPRSDKILTLLGEAYLSSGNHAQAAATFKKALQLNPDNARARDGYNEASSRVPPATDEP